MLLDSQALFPVGEAAKNFSNLIELTNRKGMTYVMKGVVPVCCFISAKRFPWPYLPENVLTMPITYSNRRFNQMLGYVSQYGIITITNRGVVSHYVIDARFMEEFIDSTSVAEEQVATFYMRFIERYNKAELLANNVKEICADDQDIVI